MAQSPLHEIKSMFPCETDTCRRNVDALLKDSVEQIGLDDTLEYREQWQILGQKLNNKSKLTCLGDRNHRLMLLQFVKAEGAQQYKSSYFNRAKIRNEYIQYLKKIGPYVFAEVITIVNKLKLIKKYHLPSLNQSYTEDHIHSKIKEIMSNCQSTKRSDNSNISKFINIVDFEDREGLIKELGKMLRTSWAKEKEPNVQQTIQTPQNIELEPLQEVKINSSGRSENIRELELIQSYMRQESSMEQYNGCWV